MKKLICVLLSFALMLTLGFSAIALQNNETVILSELSDEELLAFLLANGVEIPTQFKSEEECVAFVRYTIEAVEQNPNAEIPYGYIFMQYFSNAIIAVVRSYYGYDEMSAFTLITSNENILEDSIPIGPYNVSYDNYNCYAYVLGYRYSIEPGYIDAGYDQNQVSSIPYDDIDDMVGYVVADLVSLNYTNINARATNLVPIQGVTVHNRIICLRWETTTGGDFHFMKLEEDGCWYHKPGQTTPLKYIGSDLTEPWVQEGLGEDGYFRDEDRQYDSPIWFISYRTPCQYWGHSSYGNTQHIESCLECGATRGQPVICTFEYKYSVGDKHILTCGICGNTSGSRSPCVYINNRCRICGHTKISGSIIQSVCVQINA